jgi:hypothetical protein
VSNDAKVKTCCDMRRKVALGIAKVFSEAESGVPDSVMIDFHDFDYSSPTNMPVAAALSFRFCPWCGTKRDPNAEKRRTEVIRRLDAGNTDDDHGEEWKKGGETDED